MPAGCGSPSRVSFWGYQMLWRSAVCLRGAKPGQVLGNSSPTGNIMHEEGTAELSVGVAKAALSSGPGSPGKNWPARRGWR